MAAHHPERRLLICMLWFLVVGCSPVTERIAPAPARPTFAARLYQLSAQPAILRAAQHRLSFGSDDPASLPVALQASPETPANVRAVLARDVDEDVIVAWLVSFGAMGAWTAYDPRNSETVNVPVSEIPSLVAGSRREPGVYRLRDHRHLMLVQPVVVDDQAVGAVGFVLTETYEDLPLSAQAAPLA